MYQKYKHSMCVATVLYLK